MSRPSAVGGPLFPLFGVALSLFAAGCGEPTAQVVRPNSGPVSFEFPVEYADIGATADEEVGVIVLLREQESAREFVEAIEGLGTARDEVQERRSGDAVLRTYGIGAQILRDLGLSKIRVLSAPKQMYAISGFDLEITEYV